MDRLTQILESKEFKKIPPMTKAKVEKIRKESSRYILVDNKEDRKHGKCERCLNIVEFENNTKHKETIKCPCCGHEMLVEHTYRKKGCDFNTDFYYDGKTISSEIFILRYYEYYQNKSYEPKIREVAREIFDFKSHKKFKIEWNKDKKIWEKGNYFFVEMNMYIPRRAFAPRGELIQTKNAFVKELKKIDALKYYDYESKLGMYYYLDDDIKALLSAPLYEKMEKVGLNKLVKQDYGNGYIKWNGKATELVKMLRLDKRRYKMINPDTTIRELKFLQSYKNISEKDYLYLRSKSGAFEQYRTLKMKGIKKPIKAIDWLEDHRWKYKGNNIGTVKEYEYYHYLENLKELGIDINDSYYMTPKDFHKIDKIISDRVVEQRKKLKAEELAKQDKLIKGISDGLRNMEDLKEFMGGSKGLLVYVPESADELIAEGDALHNCIGSYVERVAEGKTLVFFVRKLEAPNEPFVAFEYCNGEVIQCRYDHNKAVEDEKIISFVDALAERLRKNNVLYKAA